MSVEILGEEEMVGLDVASSVDSREDLLNMDHHR
jgi:hypothetical protein